MIENKRVKNRRDTAANWTANNPVLLAGEFGIELDSTPIKMKIGDGATHWNDLPYAGASESEIIEIIEETTYTKQQIDTALNGKADADNVYTKTEVDNIKSEIEGEIPTVNDSTVNIYQGGTLKGSFTLNQSNGETINLDAGGVSSVDWDDITDKPDFSTVAISGEYTDLLHRPDIPVNTSDLTNDSGFITLNDVPAQVNADWNSNSGVSQILNKPTVYNEWFGTQQEYDAIVIKDPDTVYHIAGGGIQVQADWTEADTTNPAYIRHKPTIPTATSDLTNDSGFVTSSDVPTATSDLTNDSGFITLSDVPAQAQADWTEADSSDPSYIQNKPMVYTEWFGTQQEYDAILEKDSNTIYHIEGPAPAQSDWNEVNSSSMAFILNKPTIPTTTSDLTNDSGFITLSDVPAQVNADWNSNSGASQILNKPTIPANTSDLTNDSGFITLSDVPTQAQSDWNQSDSTAVDYIKNKPSIPTVNDGIFTIQKNGTTVASFTANDSSNKTANITVPVNTSDLTNDSGFITLSDVPAQVNADWNAVSGVAQILNKPTIPTATSDLQNDSGFITINDVPAQEQADWNQSDSSAVDYIKNKPTIPAAPVQSDWNEADSSSLAYIANKPSIPSAQVNSDWNAASGVAQILNKPSIPSATSDLQNDSGFITLSDVPAQVQSNWNESDTTSAAYIQNKPTIPASPVQSNWNESDATSLAYIQNKPSIPSAQVNSDWNAASGVAQILNKPSMSTETLTFTLQGGTTQTITVYIQPTI